MEIDSFEGFYFCQKCNKTHKFGYEDHHKFATVFPDDLKKTLFLKTIGNNYYCSKCSIPHKRGFKKHYQYAVEFPDKIKREYFEKYEQRDYDTPNKIQRISFTLSVEEKAKWDLYAEKWGFKTLASCIKHVMDQELSQHTSINQPHRENQELQEINALAKQMKEMEKLIKQNAMVEINQSGISQAHIQEKITQIKNILRFSKQSMSINQIAQTSGIIHSDLQIILPLLDNMDEITHDPAKQTYNFKGDNI
jgi:hypothetical protein